jgi:condensin complex subunit 1
MAVCLEDSTPRISDLSKLFFLEYSKKGNSIYNVLPDLISNLSISQSRDSFRSIMKYLFSFIKKDKQTENLVEKLCQRIKTSEPQAINNIVFCMTLLNYNDKVRSDMCQSDRCQVDT